jgi:hypothetical protein
MRRVTWLVLLGAVCVGCSRKEPPELPNVAIQPNDPGQPKPVIPAGPAQPKTFTLPYSALWDPKGTEKFDPEAVAEAIVLAQHLGEHQTEYLAPATIGSAVSIPQGGLHGVVVPAALAVAYPEAAKQMAANWTDRLSKPHLGGTPLIDICSSGTGIVPTRSIVFPIKDGTDDEIRIRFGEYLMRLEAAVKGTGTTLFVHQRGGIRLTGSLSDIRYEGENRTGYIRSVVVRKYEEADHELLTLMLGNATKGHAGDAIKRVMNAQKGPFLVVSLREEQR